VSLRRSWPVSRRLRYDEAVLLFKKAFYDGLVSGTTTLTFRRWQKPHVKVGGRYRCHPIGVLEVDDVRVVSVQSITAREAKDAGFVSREALLAYLAELGPLEDATQIHRVALRFGGDGDRVQIALDDQLTPEQVSDLKTRLARFDANGPWTMQAFALIDAQPRVAASKLAASVKRETLPFKENIRKLKKLGLTQSFEVGYEISPRGRAYLAAVGGIKKRRRRAS